MKEYEKRALCDYAQTFHIIWERKEPEGLYKFWFPFTNFNTLKNEEFIPVHYYSGFGWKIHGKMTWEAVRKLVEAHRAGKRGTELGYVVHCEFFTPIWE